MFRTRLGASGIVFMHIILSSFTNFEKCKIPLALILVVIIYVGLEVMNGILVKDNISQFAHIIGGICGGAFGFASWNRTGDRNNLQV